MHFRENVIKKKLKSKYKFKHCFSYLCSKMLSSTLHALLKLSKTRSHKNCSHLFASHYRLCKKVILCKKTTLNDKMFSGAHHDQRGVGGHAGAGQPRRLYSGNKEVFFQSNFHAQLGQHALNLDTLLKLRHLQFLLATIGK